MQCKFCNNKLEEGVDPRGWGTLALSIVGGNDVVGSICPTCLSIGRIEAMLADTAEEPKNTSSDFRDGVAHATHKLEKMLAATNLPKSFIMPVPPLFLSPPDMWSRTTGALLEELSEDEVRDIEAVVEMCNKVARGYYEPIIEQLYLDFVALYTQHNNPRISLTDASPESPLGKALKEHQDGVTGVVKDIHTTLRQLEQCVARLEGRYSPSDAISWHEDFPPHWACYMDLLAVTYPDAMKAMQRRPGRLTMTFTPTGPIPPQRIEYAP